MLILDVRMVKSNWEIIHIAGKPPFSPTQQPTGSLSLSLYPVLHQLPTGYHGWFDFGFAGCSFTKRNFSDLLLYMSCFRVTWYWTSHNLFSCLLCCFFSFLFCWLVDIILFHCPVSVFASLIDPKLANTLVRLVKILCLWYNWARQKNLGGYLRICML